MRLTLTICSPISRGVNETPIFPDGNLFKKQGSSRPDGVKMIAFSERRSASVKTPGKVTCELEPIEICVRNFLGSPASTLHANGDPAICLSPKRTEIL